MARYNAVVKDTFGMTLSAETGIDLTSFATVNLRLRKADGTWVTKVGSKNGTRIEYDPTEVDALFDTLGDVKVHSNVVAGGIDLTSRKADIIPVVAEGQL